MTLYNKLLKLNSKYVEMLHERLSNEYRSIEFD